MMNEQRLVKITAVIDQTLVNKVTTALKDAGIEDIYTTVARSPIVKTNTGFLGLFRGNTLDSRPVEVVAFIVPEEQEDDCIKLVTQSGHLDIPGHGSVYSEAVSLEESYGLCKPSKLKVFPVGEVHVFQDLIGICCVVQRGQGDAIARVVLETGSAVPWITYGTGTGVRDKLGLLRITIPAEKEVLTLIAPSWDAEQIMENMIKAGKLDLPGRGFINTFKVRKGVVDTKISVGQNSQAASLEQIIGVIDKIQGGMEWRRNEKNKSTNNSRSFFSGVDLKVVCNEGSGLKLVKSAMAAGASGATIEKRRLLGKAEKDEKYISRAREVCRMTVPADKVEEINKALKEAGATDEGSQAMVYSYPIDKAFTYMKRKA